MYVRLLSSFVPFTFVGNKIALYENWLPGRKDVELLKRSVKYQRICDNSIIGVCHAYYNSLNIIMVAAH